MSLIRIAHLSDPHFGTILPGVREGLIDSLKEISPDLILLTGDITQRARREQFREAKKFTHDLLPIRMIAVPGNHDIPLFNIFTRFLNPYWGFKNLFKDQLEKDHIHGDVVVTGLNSTSKWRHVQGDFNLKRLEKRLRDNRPSAKIHIAAFHHPMDCKKSSDEKNLLRGRDEAIQVFDRFGVDLIVGGHIHDPFVTLSTKRYPDSRRAMVIAVAGTCTSWRTRPGAPNSFNLIEINTTQAPRITISRYDQRENLKFTLESAQPFTRNEKNGWEPVRP